MSKPAAVEVTGDVQTFARNNRQLTKRAATIERVKKSGFTSDHRGI